MKKYRLTILFTAVLALTACGQSGNEPVDAVEETASAADDTAPDWDTAGIESMEIVPGLSKRILVEGSGAVAEVGHTVVVHYTGWLYDAEAENFRGDKFDSSVDRDQYFEFPLGAGRVIQGWDQGVAGMRTEKEKRPVASSHYLISGQGWIDASHGCQVSVRKTRRRTPEH